MKKLIYLAIAVLILAGIFTYVRPLDKRGNSSVKSSAYSYNEAINRGDVVFFDKVYNYDKFARFLFNVKNKTVDSIRVTAFTDEGDPLFKDLEFDGSVIHYTYDNSHDSFGGNSKGIRKDVCTQLLSEENEQGEITYTVSGCSENDSNISYFLLRTNKE